MLEPIMSSLGSQRIILASSSPRRQEILQNVGLKFEVIPSLYEENLDPAHFETPNDFVIATAKNKVLELEERLKKQGESFDMLIGADTMVYHNKQIFGKPKSAEEAFTFLKNLSGNTHEVFTGVCVRTRNAEELFCEGTKVTFGNLSDEVINSYIASGEPFDKAGGYGIQGKGATLISRVDGDYFNVVGLPLHRLCSAIWSTQKSNVTL